MDNWWATLLAPLTASKGAAYETRARHYLVAQGLGFVTRNYRCRRGEIDLIMRQGEQLSFVEVRYRARHSHGSAKASVTRQKQQRLRLAASHYLASQHLSESRQACRFDVVAFTGEQCEWLPNAF